MGLESLQLSRGPFASQADGVRPGEADSGVTPPRRQKDDAAAVRRPADDLVRAGMIGQALGDSAVRRDKIDVGVPLVLSSKSDPGSVGREERSALCSYSGGQLLGRASVPGDRPEVAGKGEDNVGCVQRRLLEDQRGLGGGRLMT